MLNLLKRWMAYFLVPAGLVLLFLPLNTHHTEMVEKDFLYLKMSESLVGEVKTKPQIVSPENPTEENLIQYLQELQGVGSAKNSTVATTTNPYGYPIIQEQTLAAFPALLGQIKHMIRRASWNQKKKLASRLDDIQVEKEWGTFKKSHLTDTDGVAFQYGNIIISEYIKSDYASVQVEIEFLKVSRNVVGGIFLFFGLLVWRRMYAFPTNGIQIGKRSGMILWDFIVISISVFFTWALLDSLLATYFQTSSVLGDVQMGLFMGVFWVSFGNLVMALFVTATDIQTLMINAEGLSVTGLFGKKFLDWSGVEDIRLAEIYSARQVGSFFAPRKLAKILEISSGSSTLRIMEPPFASTKKEILNTLIANAPEKLQESIMGLSRQWLSVW